jgi:DNA adenine methylase
MIKTTLKKARPFLKWAGGKTQLLEIFHQLYPNELKDGQIKHYYEPFLGGGAVFFDLVHHFDFERVFLYDTNADLILAYRKIRDELENLIPILQRYETDFLKLTQEERKIYYYDLREQYNRRENTDSLERAAQLIFLNKSGYNGLYRVNKNGGFNVPFGRYDKIQICDEENLRAVSRVLQNVELQNASYEQIEPDILPDSFVYFDPPYRPISASASFNAYSNDRFDDQAQEQLAQLFRRLDRVGAYLLLSNSDPKNHDPDDDFFENIYRGFSVQRVPAKRMINSKADNRLEINEIVITNY